MNNNDNNNNDYMHLDNRVSIEYPNHADMI